MAVLFRSRLRERSAVCDVHPCTAVGFETMANRVVSEEMECPRCLRRYWEDVEVADETPVPPGESTCPHCGHLEPAHSFVMYSDDIWRKPGANPAYP